MAHEQRFVADSPMFSRSRQASVMDGKETAESSVPCFPGGKPKVHLSLYNYFQSVVYIMIIL